MIFSNIISISSVHIVKSELIKFDLKKYFKNSNFEIWDLGDYFYKNKIKNLNSTEKINVNYLKKFKSLDKIKEELYKLDHNSLLIDPFNISKKSTFAKIILKKKIKILFFYLGPIPTNKNNYNFKYYLKRFINNPYYYFRKINDLSFSKITPDYLMLVNKDYIKTLNYKISSNTKIILAHSFDYNRYLDKKGTKKNNLLPYKNYAVFIDEGVTGHPDYEYLNLKTYCNKKVYFDELNRFFLYIEKKLNLRVYIAGHPKIKYSKKDNLFNRKLYINDTMRLIKNSKIVFSHMSTSINFAVIFKKPIFFLDSNNYNLILRNQIKLHSSYLKSKLINLSSNSYDNYFSNSLKINKTSYDRYMSNFITYNTKDKRTSWQILYDNINSQKKRII